MPLFAMGRFFTPPPAGFRMTEPPTLHPCHSERSASGAKNLFATYRMIYGCSNNSDAKRSHMHSSAGSFGPSPARNGLCEWVASGWNGSSGRTPGEKNLSRNIKSQRGSSLSWGFAPCYLNSSASRSGCVER